MASRIGNSLRSVLRKSSQIAGPASRPLTSSRNHIVASSFAATNHRCFTTAPARRTLGEVLKKEIEAETALVKEQGSDKMPQIDGWEITTEEAAVKLTKMGANEKITVSFNVNHTVTTPESEDYDQQQPEQHDMGGVSEALPPFTVEITKNNQTLAFECEPLNPMDMPEPNQAAPQFDIVELYVYSGEEPNKNVYITGGGIVDAELYDEFLTYLNDRGINDAFFNQMIDLASAHEHNLYVDLLKKIRAHVA